MSRELLSFFGPRLKEAGDFQAKIRQLGGECRLVHDGNGSIDFGQVFNQSLFGFIESCNDGWDQIGTGQLTSLERELLCFWEKERRVPGVMTVIDFDGVLVSPSHTAYKLVKNFVDGGVGLADLARLAKQEGRVGYGNFRGLAKVSQLSESTVVWTSRVNLPESALFNYFRDGICYFPFFDRNSQTRLSKLGKGKISVETNKPIFSAEEKLFEIIERSNPEIIYYIGSSRRDRKTVVAFLKKYPQMAGKLVFFDTCHWYF